MPYLDIDTVKLHLYKQGFPPNHCEWVCHGEAFDKVSHSGSSSNAVEGDNLTLDMVLDFTLQIILHIT